MPIVDTSNGASSCYWCPAIVSQSVSPAAHEQNVVMIDNHTGIVYNQCVLLVDGITCLLWVLF